MTSTLDILTAIADPIRLKLLRAIAHHHDETGSASTHTCTQHLDLSQPTLSYHFKTLLQAEVIVEHKAGTKKFYALNSELLQKKGIMIELLLK